MRFDMEVFIMDRETHKKKLMSAAETFEKKARREWAYAKNDKGNEHYAYARTAFDKAKELRDKANKL